MKKTVLVYGLCGGLLIAALGIRLGLTLTRRPEVVVREVAVPAHQPFTSNDAKVSELGITPRNWKSWSGSPAA